jgi:hypothetical protein
MWGRGETKPRTLLVGRCNHALGDGYSFLKIIAGQWSEKVETVKFKPVVQDQKSILNTTLRIVSYLIRAPYEFMNTLFVAQDSDASIIKEPVVLQNEAELKLSYSSRIRTDFIKELKNKFNTSFTSI